MNRDVSPKRRIAELEEEVAALRTKIQKLQETDEGRHVCPKCDSAYCPAFAKCDCNPPVCDGCLTTKCSQCKDPVCPVCYPSCFACNQTLCRCCAEEESIGCEPCGKTYIKDWKEFCATCHPAHLRYHTMEWLSCYFFLVLDCPFLVVSSLAHSVMANRS